MRIIDAASKLRKLGAGFPVEGDIDDESLLGARSAGVIAKGSSSSYGGFGAGMVVGGASAEVSGVGLGG